MVSASQQFARPAYVNAYSVAGLSISVESDRAWIAAAFDRQFSGSHLDRCTRNGEPSATIRIVDSSPPALPFDLESFAVAEDGQCFTDGFIYHIAYNDSLVSVEGNARAHVNVWLGGSAISGAVLARLFFTAVAAAVRRCGLYELHAGCVVEPTKGAGVLLVGPSGSGKSTLTAQLAAHGWEYLSDDSLLLCVRNERTEVHALRRVFSLTEHAIEAGTLRGVDRTVGQPMDLDPAKRRFDPVEVFPERFVESCTPSLVLFPSVTRRAASRFEKLTSPQSMATLIRMCPWASYDRVAARGYLEALSRLAKHCKAYRFRVGTDLFGEGEQSSRFIKTLL